jgi:hypothetical protein
MPPLDAVTMADLPLMPRSMSCSSLDDLSDLSDLD